MLFLTPQQIKSFWKSRDKMILKQQNKKTLEINPFYRSHSRVFIQCFSGNYVVTVPLLKLIHTVARLCFNRVIKTEYRLIRLLCRCGSIWGRCSRSLRNNRLLSWLLCRPLSRPLSRSLSRNRSRRYSCGGRYGWCRCRHRR